MSFFEFRGRKRLKQIAHVLFQNQMDFILEVMKLRKYLPIKKRFSPLTIDEKKLMPKHVLKIFEELDGSFIKLGQLLSLRPDLIPIEYCNELSSLQDTVKPFSGVEAKKIIEKELKNPIEKIFSHFEEKPIASASIGQVHKAKLKTGEIVAVKIQRPKVQETIRQDIILLKKLTIILKKRYNKLVIDPNEIIKEFERYSELELDFLREAKNIDIFNEIFSKKKLKIPKLYWDYTTSKIVTTEFIEGTHLSKIKKFTPQRRKIIIETVLDSFLEQVFEYGIFHADPHPGNFIVMKNNKIALLDYGIVGKIDDEMREDLGSLYIGMMKGKSDPIVDAAIRLGIAEEDNTYKPQLKRDINEKLSPYYGTPLGKVKLSEILNKLIEIFREHHLSISPDLLLLAKCTVTLEGFCSTIHPKYDIVKRTKTFVRKLIKKRLNPKRIAKRVAIKSEEVFNFISDIPRTTNIFLRRIRATEQDLSQLDKEVSCLNHNIETSSNRIAFGFIIGALFISSAIFLNIKTISIFGMSAFSFFGFSTALILSIFLFTSIVREGADKI